MVPHICLFLADVGGRSPVLVVIVVIVVPDTFLYFLDRRLHVIQRLFAMAALVMLGLLQLPLGILQSSQGVTHVRLFFCHGSESNPQNQGANYQNSL